MELSQEHILTTLDALRPGLTQKYGVEIFGIVGSWARNNAGPDSDIDIVYRIKNMEKFLSIPWNVGALWNEFQDKFECDVDIIDWEALKPRHKNTMRKELVKFYG